MLKVMTFRSLSTSIGSTTRVAASVVAGFDLAAIHGAVPHANLVYSARETLTLRVPAGEDATDDGVAGVGDAAEPARVVYGDVATVVVEARFVLVAIQRKGELVPASIVDRLSSGGASPSSPRPRRRDLRPL